MRLLGARRSLLSLVANLDPERWKPIVCGQSHGDLEDALRELNIPFEVLKTGWWRKGKYFLWRPFAIARMRALIRRTRADVIHCNEIYPNPYAVRARGPVEAEMGRHIPVVTHMRLAVTPRMIRNYDLARADRIVVPSATAGRDFDLWAEKDEKVRVIYNGVDLSEFRRTRSTGEARRQIGVPGDGPLLAAIGQTGPRKGGDVILRAFAEIAKSHPQARLMFVGNAHRGQEEFAEALHRRAAEPDLAGRVFFFGFTQRILPYYEATDVNLLISRSEGFGRTIIEAGAVGVPSIGARTGGIPELIEEGKTGLLVASEDSADLTAAMKNLLDNPSLRENMGEAVFRHVARNFSITAHAERIMELYDSLLQPV